MRLKPNHLPILLLTSLLLLSCTQEDGLKGWTDKHDEISITLKGKTIMAYSPDKWQTGHSGLSFWSMRDDLEEYFRLDMDKAPLEGTTTTAELIFRFRGKKEKSDRLKLETIKTGEDGKIWLYDRGKQLGIIIGPVQ